VQEKAIRGLTGSIVILTVLLISGRVAYAAMVTPRTLDASMIVTPISGSRTSDPIRVAQYHFELIESYQVRVSSLSAQGDATVIRYSYRKPGYVRMDFTEPHNGAALIYSPDSGQVRLWPFGMNTLPVLSLLPTNTLIRDKSGHRVDKSDIGTLLRNIRLLQQGGNTVILGDEVFAHQPASHLSITGPAGFTVDKVHRCDIWLDNRSHFPVKVISYGVDQQQLETVIMEAMIINLHFPERFFTP
jgi:outer membrane lipoprotein-sorting protein